MLDPLKVVHCNEEQVWCSHSKLDHLNLSQDLVRFTLVEYLLFDELFPQLSRNYNHELISLLVINLKLFGACQHHIGGVLVDVVQILVKEIDVDKVELVKVEQQLRTFDGAAFVIKWDSLGAADELPVIVVDDLFREENVLHSNVLHLRLSTGQVSNQDIIYLEVTQFLSVISEDLIFNPLPNIIIDPFLSALDLVFIEVRCPTESKHIELLLVLVEILLTLDVWIV